MTTTTPRTRLLPPSTTATLIHTYVSNIPGVGDIESVSTEYINMIKGGRSTMKLKEQSYRNKNVANLTSKEAAKIHTIWLYLRDEIVDGAGNVTPLGAFGALDIILMSAILGRYLFPKESAMVLQNGKEDHRIFQFELVFNLSGSGRKKDISALLNRIRETHTKIAYASKAVGSKKVYKSPLMYVWMLPMERSDNNKEQTISVKVWFYHNSSERYVRNNYIEGVLADISKAVVAGDSEGPQFTFSPKNQPAMQMFKFEEAASIRGTRARPPLLESYMTLVSTLPQEGGERRTKTASRTVAVTRPDAGRKVSAVKRKPASAVQWSAAKEKIKAFAPANWGATMSIE